MNRVQGKLYIKFDIDFPENGMLSSEARSLLVQVYSPFFLLMGNSGCKSASCNVRHEENLTMLVQALPAAPVPQSFPDAEEVTMQDADIANLGRNNRGGRGGAHDEDEDDDEEGRGGQRVQCAQQ